MRITQEQFKNDFGGDLSRLTENAATDGNAAKPARKKYVYLEFELQKNLAGYLNSAYPSVLFECSPINLKLTKAQRGMMKAIQKNDFHPPDMKIYQPNKFFAGFALELKTESPFKINGELKKSEHLENQWQSILKMRKQGWKAGFYWEFETARKALDSYLREIV